MEIISMFLLFREFLQCLCIYVFSKSNLIFQSSVKLKFFFLALIFAAPPHLVFCIFHFPPVDLISQVTCSGKKKKLCFICGIMACHMYNFISGYDVFCEYAFNYVSVSFIVEQAHCLNYAYKVW